MAGCLYLVATPIGNLEDLSARAIRVLREVAVIACEDTRQTRKLLVRQGIATPTVSYHQHNEKRRAAELIGRLLAGDAVALVSDAGMPLISDPGHALVVTAVERGIVVTPIPGASALVAALAASGLPTQPFLFAGFLPSAASARRRQWQAWRERGETIVFYEAPHRIVASLTDAAEILGPDRLVAVARELTKVHEEFIRGSLGEVLTRLAAVPPRGEFTVVLAPAVALPGAKPISEADAAASRGPMARLADLLAGGAEPRVALKQVARESGQPKSRLYREWQIAKQSSNPLGQPPGPGGGKRRPTPAARPDRRSCD